MANPVVNGGYASPQSIYEVYSATATNQTRAIGQHKVGTRATLPDGRVFYYASAGSAANLTVGTTLIASALNRSTSHASFAVTDSYANFAVGAQYGILLTDSDADADFITNEYAEGYMGFEQPDGAAHGHIYKIRGHTSADASSSSTTAGALIDLYDPILVAADASDELNFCRNPWDRVITASTNEEEMVVGVTPCAVTKSDALATDVDTTESATTTYFFWAQTWGPAMVEVDDTTITLGISCTSADTADRLEAATTGTFNSTTGTFAPNYARHVAIGLVTAVDEVGDFGMVYLTIAP